jgi:amidase
MTGPALTDPPDRSDELAGLDATAQAELVRTGAATPKELVEAAIERIERLNPVLNAVIHPLFDKAREQAASELPDGPFRGVPMVVKDLICRTAGDPMHEGMRFLKDLGWTEREDSFLAAKFRAAGFVFVGRTNAPELGILPTTEPEAYGPTGNPWDTGRSTGGSSGGSAAAVASGMVPVGHANDGGGSIRIPASECGLFGLKPSRGRTSLGPDFGDMISGLVVEHVVTRSVRDSAAVLDAVAGPMPGDPYAAPPPARPHLEEVGANPGRLRIGFFTEAPGGTTDTHPDCVAAVQDAARLLESLGHAVEPSAPAGIEDPEYIGQFLTLWGSGQAWNLDHWSARTGRTIGQQHVEPLTWALAEMGRQYHGGQVLSAVEWLQRGARRIAEWYEGGFDLLLSPTIAEPPPPLGEFVQPPDNPLQAIFRAASIVPFTPLFNATGQPAASIPLFWNEEGLPIGVQLAAPYGREDVLFRICAQLEDARPWRGRRPPVHA